MWMLISFSRFTITILAYIYVPNISHFPIFTKYIIKYMIMQLLEVTQYNFQWNDSILALFTLEHHQSVSSSI